MTQLDSSAQNEVEISERAKLEGTCSEVAEESSLPNNDGGRPTQGSEVANAADDSNADEDGVLNSTFFKSYFTTKGAPQILVLTLLLSLGSGSFVSIVPSLMGDRFARVNHGYAGPPCDGFDGINGGAVPIPCRQGGDEAQNAAAGTAFLKNALVLVFSSIVGSITDCRGRRGFLAFSFLLLALSPMMLWMLQTFQTMSPLWFYASQASHGMVSSFTICLTMLSDIMPPSLRAASFGLFLSTHMLGFAFSQFFAAYLSHLNVAALATVMLLLAALFSLLALPETLSEEAKTIAIAKHAEESYTWDKIMLRPILELSILNRNKLFRLLAAISLCSGMIYSSDTTLIIYYMKNQINIGYQSISSILFWTSLLGVLVQTFVLKAMIRGFGEKHTLIIGLAIGGLHNLLYGVAASKLAVCIGMAFSEFSSMHFPVLVSIRSINVGEDEQGHVQGAFFALAAIADATGPVFLQSIYKKTKDTVFPGPGAMFVAASAVYLAGALIACALPAEKANSRRTSQQEQHRQHQLQQQAQEDESTDEISGEPLLGNRPSLRARSHRQ